MNTLDRDDTAFHDHIRATLVAVARSTPIDGVESAMAPRETRRRPVAMWAAAAAFVLLAGTALWIRDATSPSPTAPGAPTPAAIAFLVPSTLDNDQVVYTGTRQGPIESDSGADYVPWADRVYAPANGFDSPRQLVGVTVTGSGFCPEGTVVDVNGNDAFVCEDFYDATALSWMETGGAVNVVAGGLTSMPQLVEFADSFEQLRSIGDDSAVPDGWTLLSDNRDVITPTSHQVVYTVGPMNAGTGLEYVEVRIWSQVPRTALYAIGFPLIGESVTVRGGPAILDAKETDNPFLFWVEPSGSVVSLQALGGDRQTIIAFANGLQETDQAGFDEFVAGAVDPPFALPRDQLPNSDAGVGAPPDTAD